MEVEAPVQRPFGRGAVSAARRLGDIDTHYYAKTYRDCNCHRVTPHSLVCLMSCHEGLTKYRAIVLGARGEPFNLSSRITAIGVDQDLQLTFIGLVNRIVEMLTQDALSHIASTILTSWMIRQGSGGTLSDLEMLDEFKQPWTALVNFLERRKPEALAGRSWKNGFRLLSSLAIGLSLLLLGAAMNTVAIPKTRWWPDTRFEVPRLPDDRFFFKNQTSRVGSVSRMSMWGQSWNMLRIGGSVSWEMVSFFICGSRRR
jgi:hypothetical protein